jgi:hypothetical protein
MMIRQQRIGLWKLWDLLPHSLTLMDLGTSDLGPTWDIFIFTVFRTSPTGVREDGPGVTRYA